jgi:hypothetical protein
MDFQHWAADLFRLSNPRGCKKYCVSGQINLYEKERKKENDHHTNTGSIIG